MPTKKEIRSQTDLVQSMQDLVQTYEQYYVGKMQSARKSVTSTRYFMQGISEVFHEVKDAYILKVTQDLSKRKKNANWSPLDKDKKQAAVFLSASAKLSGDINKKVYRSFLDYIQTHPETEVIIAGSLGKRMFDQQSLNRKYFYFELPEKVLTMEDLKEIVQSLIKYEHVNVFYGKFSSFANQKEEITNISGNDVLPEKQDLLSIQDRKSFLFEPELVTLLHFFEERIIATLFKQTVHESYLAQVGSRIMTLESASTQIEDKLHELNLEKRKITKRNRNKKQLNSLTGLKLWNTR